MLLRTILMIFGSVVIVANVIGLIIYLILLTTNNRKEKENLKSWFRKV